MYTATQSSLPIMFKDTLVKRNYLEDRKGQSLQVMG